MNESTAPDCSEAFAAFVVAPEPTVADLAGEVIPRRAGGAFEGDHGRDDGIVSWPSLLADLAAAGTAAGKIDQIRALENVKSACAAAQARITAAFVTARRASATPDGDSATDAAALRATIRLEPDSAAPSGQARSRGQHAALLRAKAQRLASRSAAAEVALARRESPQRGGMFVGLAEALVREMPNTLSCLESGTINEWRATIVVRETACLTKDQRTALDAEIAGRLDGLGDARLQAMVKTMAYRLDPESATKRAERAAGDRRVSLRPAPDCMGYLTQLLPIAAATACYGALRRAADASPGGDGRTHAQRMADEAVVRLARTAPTAVGGPPTSPTAPAEPGTPAGPGTPAEPGTPAGPGTPADAGEAVSAPDVAVARAESDRSATTPKPDTPDRTPAGAAPAGARLASEPDVRGGHTPPFDPVAEVRAAYARAVAGKRVSVRGDQHGSSNPGTERPGHLGVDTVGEGRKADRGDATSSGATSNRVASSDATSSDMSPGDAAPGDPRFGASAGQTRDRRALQQPTADSPASEPSAAWALPAGADVRINLVVTDETLFGGGDEPARLPGNIPMPAPLARRMIAELPNTARVWVRRLYTRPGTAGLVGMDSRDRTVPPAMRRLLLARDHDTCRTPWCNAPARHADHLVPASQGGPTSIENGQALSEDCNYIRTAAGWRAAPDSRQPGRILVTAPTGHTYPSPAPGVPEQRRDRHPASAAPPTAMATRRNTAELHLGIADRLEILLAQAV